MKKPHLETKRISVRSALASTIGMDLAELEDYRYQSTRQRRAIYTIGDHFYCTGKTPPKADDGFAGTTGLKWERHPDQFWAEQAGTVVWVARSSDG